MARSFKDPQDELRFLDQVEEELERLAEDGTLDGASLEAVRERYSKRRAELRDALSSRRGLLSAEALARRGTVPWIAWVGVVLVVTAVIVFTSQSWEALSHEGRLAILVGFTVAAFVGAWYLYMRTGLRRTGLAVLSAATAMVMVDLGYTADVYEIGSDLGFGPDVAAVVFGVGMALFALWAWRLKESILIYVAIALAVMSLNAGIDWGFQRWEEQLLDRSNVIFSEPLPTEEEVQRADRDYQDLWEPYYSATGIVRLAGNGLLGLAMLAAGWLIGTRYGWRSANPLVFGGALWFLGALVFIDDSLIPGTADGFLAFVASLGLLWFGLSRQRIALSVAATIGFAAAVIRVETEFLQDFLSRTLSLLALGLAIIFLAVVFERRRREILDRLGTWE